MSQAAAAARASVNAIPAWRRALSAGGRIGPGLVFALSTVGVGDFVTNSAAGAQHRYQLLWLLIVAAIFRFIWLRTSAKYVLVTGETLIRGYSRLGNWLVWVVFVAMTVVRHFYSLFKYPLFGQCLNMIAPLGPHGVAIWAVLTVAASIVFLYTGGYTTLERILRWVVFLMGVALIAAAGAAHPDTGGIMRGLLFPSPSEAGGGYGMLLLAMAIIGTEVGTTQNITYSYFVQAKGWRSVDHWKIQQRDLLTGIGTMFLMGALVQVAAAGTLFGGPPPRDISDLFGLFASILGSFGRFVLGIGLWSAAFCGTLAISAGNGMIVTDMCRNVLPGIRKIAGAAPKDRPLQKDPIYRGVILFWYVSPLYVLFTSWKPVYLGLLASAVGLVLMPVMSLALLRITNDKALMGERKNGFWSNAGLVLMFAVSSGFLIRAAWDLVHGWMS